MMFSLWINNRTVNISLIISAFLAILFFIFPELDISFSKLFFSAENRFVYRKNFLVYQIYKLLPWLTKLFVLFCLIHLLYIGIKNRSLEKIVRSGIFFLLITATISPGLIVNGALKETFGRARPSQIKEFDGTKNFTKPFEISNQCTHNCSFSSGHAAMGYFFSAIAYTTSLIYFNKIYIAGIVFGSIVGLSRVMMGGHFLSDVVTSAFVVLFFNHLIFILWQILLKNLKK